jgi:hypothetical protein
MAAADTPSLEYTRGPTTCLVEHLNIAYGVAVLALLHDDSPRLRSQGPGLDAVSRR